MPRLREKKRLREQRILGIKTGIPTYVPPELITRGFKLKFYDTADVKIGELGSDVKTGKVIDVSFELRQLGCGAFSFILDDKPSFTIGFRTRVDIHPYFDPSPWFTGFIQAIPQTGQKRPFEYTGFGFYDQLDWVTITDSYTSQELADIVKDIIQNDVAPNTQIIYNVSKIIATGYTVQSIDFDHTFAKDAVQTLADMAQNYEFGVDDSREFYFRPITTTVQYSYWVGKHFQNVQIKEDPFTVRNKLYIKMGEIQAGGSNIIGSIQNDESIAAYGLREEVITVPESLNSTDAIRWANLILSEKSVPAVKAKIANILFDETKAKIIAKGKARITMYEGTEYSLFIRAISYSITAGGILGKMELEWEISGLEERILNIVKEFEEEKRLADKRAKQLYDLASGGGDKPAFYAYQGADTNNVTGDGTNYPVIFGTEIYDLGANYNPATGIFTAPVDGRYVFSFCVLYDDLNVVAYQAMGTTFVTSNRAYKCEYADGSGHDNQGRKSQTATVTCEMDANDTVYINAYVWGGAKSVDIRGHATLQYTYFNGVQLC